MSGVVTGSASGPHREVPEQLAIKNSSLISFVIGFSLTCFCIRHFRSHVYLADVMDDRRLWGPGSMLVVTGQIDLFLSSRQTYAWI